MMVTIYMRGQRKRCREVDWQVQSYSQVKGRSGVPLLSSVTVVKSIFEVERT
jgi:hypothetical protein